MSGGEGLCVKMCVARLRLRQSARSACRIFWDLATKYHFHRGRDPPDSGRILSVSVDLVKTGILASQFISPFTTNNLVIIFSTKMGYFVIWMD